MSLVFGGANSDRVSCSGVPAVSASATWLVWHFPTTRTSGRRIFGRSDGATYDTSLYWSFFGNGLSLGASFSTTAAAADSTKTFTLNKWAFSAATLRGAGNNPKIFTGDLSAAATEDSYSGQTAPAGSVSDDSSVNLAIGNVGTGFTSAYQGNIAVAAYFARELTLGEIVRWQFRPFVDADCKYYLHLGFNGTGTQPDWSGNGVAGTVTGATARDHVPMAPMFAFPAWRPMVAPPPTPFDWLAMPAEMRAHFARPVMIPSGMMGGRDLN